MAPEPPARSAAIRGSSLLLVGRAISLLANFGTQVLIVRHFSKSDFGAFAYALVIVNLVATVVTLGLDRAITRFVAIYEEREEYGKLIGTIVLQIGTIVSLGLAAVIGMQAARGWLSGSLMDDGDTVALLAVLIVLGPLQALDDMMVQLFAVFAKPSAIFFRRNLLGPGLRLLVVLSLIAGGWGVSYLAVGYVAASAAGVGLSGVMLLRLMRQRGLLPYRRHGRVELPIREITAFTVPLLTSDLVYMLVGASAVVILGAHGGPEDVAAFRAVVPLAALCQLVMTSFSLLFTPTASRLLARQDTDGVRDLYWQTAAWMAVLTFPIFALTFSMAGSVTTTLFGERYADSAGLLALLALGQYFQSAFGFNGLTLKVFAKLRYLVVINLVVAGVNLALNLILIPRHGALGAAVATAATLILHNILKQAGLRLVGINLFERRFLRLYGTVVVLASCLAALDRLAHPPLLLGLLLVGAASAGLAAVARRELEVGDTFPELARLLPRRRPPAPVTTPTSTPAAQAGAQP